MPLIVETMPGVRSAAISWFLPLGSATDPAPLEGLSTMWSEMIFRGSGELDSRAHADSLDRLGLARSADVSTFHLRLGFTLIGDRLAESLPVLVNMVRRPRCEEASVEPVRDLALQGLASLADDPQERAVLATRSRHAPPPLNRSGLGTEAGLNAVTRELMMDQWLRQVRPEGCILAIAGAVGSMDAIAQQLDALLTGWRGAPTPVTWTPNPLRGSYYHELDATASQVQVVLFHDSPPEPSPDTPCERVVNSVLSGGMSSRLFTEVREKRGLCYSVSSSYTTDRTFGRTLAYVGTTPERAQQSLDVLHAELKRVSTPVGSITPEEYKRSITGIQSSLVFAGESTSARAAALATDQHRVGRPRSLDELRAGYERLTLDQVNAYLARRTLGETTVVTLGPAALVPPAP
ncbi:MAG: insulinase family protein [Phycisphaerales bacterium]|nr:insulinase family protein [Phycisphaerales bacterium]